jgi:hypothetical protein
MRRDRRFDAVVAVAGNRTVGMHVHITLIRAL